MGQSRILPLFDPTACPQSWNERMSGSEYATLYSRVPNVIDRESLPHDALFCVVFSTLAEAEEDASRQVIALPTLRCRIYDHHGLGRQPTREICGREYKGEWDFSARFRRWCGSTMLVGGIALIAVDWRADFGLLWPAMFGTRMIPIGLFLLATELVYWIEAERKSRRIRHL